MALGEAGRQALEVLFDDQVPADLRELVASGQLAYERTTIADTSYLVTGGRVPGTEAEAYFFFSEEDLWSDLTELALGAGHALRLPIPPWSRRR